MHSASFSNFNYYLNKYIYKFEYFERGSGLVVLKFLKFLNVFIALMVVAFADDIKKFFPFVLGESSDAPEIDNYEWFNLITEPIDVPINIALRGTDGKTKFELFEDDRYIQNTYGSLLEANGQTSLQETIEAALLDYDYSFLIHYTGDELEDFEQILANAYYSNSMIVGTVLDLQYGVEKAKEGDYFIHFNVVYTTNNIEMATIKPLFEEFYAGLDLEGKSIDEKIERIHRAVIEQIEYVDGGYARHHSPYGFFVMGEGVCQSYAIAMQMLLEKAGVESYYVVGYLIDSVDDTAHAWNLVKTEEGWRHIDATSNDMGARFEDQVSLDFYHMTDEEAGQYYVWDKKFYPDAK